MTKVMVFGTFDGIHPGHLNFFKQAKKYGDFLIVVVARDKTIKRIKKHLPSLKERERLKIIENCQLVNKAFLGRLQNPYWIIKKIKPNVICLGYDQIAFTEDLGQELKKMGLKTKVYRLKPYKPERYHSIILNKGRPH